MLTDNELNAANAYGEWLRLAVHERELPASQRVRASAGCLAIAQDHHHAIVVLLDSRLYASVLALVRVAFEAYVRGEWLWLCATDAEVRRFLKGKEPPGINLLLEALEKTPAFQEQALSKIKKRTWNSMCGYTHTGGLHVQRWITADGIEPNYSKEELLEALRFADIIASLSVLGVLTIAEDDAMAQKVLDRYKARMEE
ncbi:MAG: hypothetical protein A2710_05670 [Burkholderiales bacterium RIFCSPHIGHO2_01_FULL_64_960]|nr:MAG: hypothetical protein A2710_05670 [Burkholderiales bacterium RIFCSPHIGHO2_01_FULL_64_960]OGB11313.1 MAG: hypothetical protein A3C40_05645 [Burkholderiales bacterium RIFCSPHIGHO2_02_FULL_64_19]OGB19904.1 MAG: hypothetical protein A3E23_16710 [Burkholderiales bacterium RIFCSPHIGHO2_12_FULL_65_48]OGB52789.1 MAG: hypothetical protein A3F71_12090 [Burkholderiales bacterium RIFCSPLOWO2_12_FULL_64_33]